MISLEKLKILTPLQKLPKNVKDLGKLIVAKGFKKLSKVQKIANSGHTGADSSRANLYLEPSTFTYLVPKMNWVVFFEYGGDGIFIETFKICFRTNHRISSWDLPKILGYSFTRSQVRKITSGTIL